MNSYSMFIEARKNFEDTKVVLIANGKLIETLINNLS